MTRTLLLLLLPLTSACLLNPNQGEPLCGANANVTFSGYTTIPNQTISLQAATSRTGTFTTFSTVVSGNNPLHYAGYDLYPFSKTVQIPTWEPAGNNLRTYVRARANWNTQTVTFFTFDQTPPTGANASACITTRVTLGDTLPAATDYCASDDSPVAEIIVSALSTCPCTNATFTGNLVIDDALDAANYVCLQTLTGNLTVTNTAPELVPFPSLTSITGNAELHYERPVGPEYNRRTIDLPALTSIGGNVSLTGRTTQSPPTTPTGLHAVTFVGGDIDIRLYGANPNVFANLTHLDGNLSIHGWTQNSGNLDINGGNTLPALTSVDGDVHVWGFFSTLSVLNALQTVGGNLTVERVRFWASPSFQAIQNVQGNLHFVNVSWFGGLWPSLTTVGGELGFFDHPTFNGLDDMLSIGAISVHALRLENNASLAALNSTLQVGAGNIEIHGNPALSECEVDAFLAAQQGGGWSGTANVSGVVSCP